MTATTTNNTMNITTTIKPATSWNKETYKHTCHFPASGAYEVHQTGQALSNVSKGLTVAIHQQVGKPAPHCFEFWTNDESKYAEGGLWFEGTSLTEYDGVFSLPKEVIAMLKALGYNTEYAE